MTPIPTADDFAESLARKREFFDGSEWHRSNGSNLCRTWHGLRLTIFRRAGAYRFCIAETGAEPAYSERSFASVGDAMTALARERRIGIR